MSEETTAPEATTAQGESNNPNLNIQDLVNVLQVIGTCSQRGAFQASELSSVGGLYDRIHAFLVATGALPAQEQESTNDQTSE